MMSIEVVIFMVAMFAISMIVARRLSLGRYPATLLEVLLTVAAVFHILPEFVFLSLGAHHCRYRDTLSSSMLDMWGVLAGVGMILLSAGSMAAVVATGPRTHNQGSSWKPHRFAMPSWVLLYGATLSYALTGGSHSTHESENYFAGGLTRTLLVAVAMVAIALSAQSTKRPVTCLVLGAAAAAPLGSRAAAAVTSIGALLLLHRAGLTIAWRRLALVGLTVAACIVTLSMIRSAGLRLETDDDFETRVSKLGSWAEEPVSSTRFDAVLEDFTYRFDGNSFCALVLQAQMAGSGRPSTAWQTAQVMWLTTLPAALAPWKHDRPIEALNEEEMMVSAYQLPSDDYLPTLMASPLAAFGPIGFCAALFLVGVLLGLLDRHLSCRSSIGMVLTAGFATALIAYEHSLQGVLVQLRSTVVLAMAVAAVRLAAIAWRLDGRLRLTDATARRCA